MSNANKSLFILVITAFFPALSAFTAHAQFGASDAVTTTQFADIVGAAYGLLYPVAIIYGIFQIIIAGYGIMRSEGEPKKLEEAKEHLTGSLIGVIFVVLAIVILRIIIKSLLGGDI